MDLFILLILIAFGAYILKSKDQKRRIALLGEHLGQYQIEKLMETLTQGYLRALAEPEAERRTQIWQLLSSSEEALCAQFNRFVAEFAKVDEAQTRVSKLAFALPFADQLFPGNTFDVRKALKIHAQGLAEAVQNNRQQSDRDKAFTVSAELFLMQHTCHWFCRSKTVASMRILARHKTAYAQLVASVSPATRKAYNRLVGE
jgi:hypothetical protein